MMASFEVKQPGTRDESNRGPIVVGSVVRGPKFSSHVQAKKLTLFVSFRHSKNKSMSDYYRTSRTIIIKRPC